MKMGSRDVPRSLQSLQQLGMVMPPHESATVLMQQLFLPRTASQKKLHYTSFHINRLSQSLDSALQIFYLRKQHTTASKN